jgi:hypothetical protein
MPIGLLFRFAVYLIGLQQLLEAVKWAAYYAETAFSGVGTINTLPLAACATFNILLPILLAMACFGFAQAITKILFGSMAEKTISLERADLGHLANLVLKVLGLYHVGISIGPLIATITELLKNNGPVPQFPNAASDLVSNTVTLAFGLYLTVKTNRVLAMMKI